MQKTMVGATLAVMLMGSAAVAGPYDQNPQVIPGIGPERSSSYGYGYGEPRAAAPDYAYAPRPRRPNYGGGLIEFMMGGPASEPEPRRMAYASAPQPYPTAQAVQPGAYAASYDPQPAKVLDPMFQRQHVAFDGSEGPGTIVIDTSNKFLYLVEGQGQALRYGIGVGRPGFLWKGTKTISRKAEWPDWTPPAEMMQRRPDLPPHMEGGLANPLGARAMYLGSSLYRIHGTNEPDTIGTNVSSGCIRLTNEDVSDLYSRVRVGTRVIVM